VPGARRFSGFQALEIRVQVAQTRCVVPHRQHRCGAVVLDRRQALEVSMSISPRLSNYLDQSGAQYEVCAHPHSRSSAETARLAQVPEHQLAKSVILEDDDGCVVAVVPADSRVQLAEVSRMLGRHALRLSDEAKIGSMFDGCELGAVPAFGMAWGVETVVDDELERNPQVYVETGDHESLLRMSNSQFSRLMSAARHGRFSHAPTQ
jgi:Ala-tRNA(Pro) deacylase